MKWDNHHQSDKQPINKEISIICQLLGPLAKIVSLQQVQSLEDVDYHQPLHEHLGFVS